ncbi:MAG: (2Fe-2S)-binding protein [archaeon GBS-70-058]|nr:(2Fe-2S)-binding protein [Candidatus Culexarchaeum nevadense]
MKIIRFQLNGKWVEVEIEENMTLLDLLRRKLHITSVKRGCERGECGVCTVLLDDKPVYSCLTPALKAEGRSVITVEYLSKNGKLHPIQEAFIKSGAVQCGFCTPAFILTTYALLKENKNPSEEDIKRFFDGIICRCTGYVKIIEAVKIASELCNQS